MRKLVFMLIALCSLTVQAQTVSYEKTVEFLMKQTESLTTTTIVNGETIIAKTHNEIESVSSDGTVVMKKFATLKGESEKVYKYVFTFEDFKQSAGGYNSKILPYFGGTVVIEISLRGPGYIRSDSFRTGMSKVLIVQFMNEVNAQRWLNAFDNAVNTSPESPF
jgi:hypothetical protein